MITPDCELAGRVDVALGEAARERLHRRCPGAYRTPAGGAHECGCACHRESVDLAAATKGRLPIVDPPPADRPETVDKGRKRAAGTPPRGRCECCGEPCRARFLPGHDAKLKSRLTRDAAAGDVEASAELWVRGWMRLVHGRIPREVVDDGSELANHAGDSFLPLRVERRTSGN